MRHLSCTEELASVSVGAVAVASSFVRVLIFFVLGNVKCLQSYKLLVLITIQQQLSIRKLALCMDPKKPIQCNKQKRYEHLGLFMVRLICTMKNMLAIRGEHSLCMLVFRL